jgi:hypothetical protein
MENEKRENYQEPPKVESIGNEKPNDTYEVTEFELVFRLII